ncbi:MAG TPA: adenylate/guanylate cyclase domain-containing protein [Chloroflexia bacterium]|nr:adenylate/guanylate cyclase domain-containing protein [Chloroflexia bacterium]
MTEREQLEHAIATLEAQRGVLGDAVAELALTPLRQRLAAVQAAGSGASAGPAEQRKQVTVLFADVSGFTAMSESLDPEEVLETMNALWQQLDGAITTHGGTIDKHIGDAVMALFGAPTAHEDDPERAIRAALAMQAELLQFAEERSHPAAQGPNPQMRIGIHTGPVLLGAVGSTAEYTAMGDTVNVASRLEQAAPVGSILISHDTYRHVRGLFVLHALEPVNAKGKSEPIGVYLVESARSRVFRLTGRGVEGIDTRMVGRTRELATLQAIYGDVTERAQARVVTVNGEAGVGKSRLLTEFSAWVDLRPEEVWFFQARADPQMTNLPYRLVRDLLASRFEIQDSDRASVAREKLVAGITSFMGPEISAGAAPFIGQLLGFDFSASPDLHGILGDARQIRARAFAYFTHFIAAVARDHGGPAVLYLEDIHWADDNSLDLVDYLARECRQIPLLIVAVTRPVLLERRPAWGEGWPSHTAIQVDPLSPDDSRALVLEILRRIPTIPAALCDLVVARAAGNPFYAEELIKMLIDDGVIVPGVEHWQVAPGRLATVRVPATLTGVLQARVDGLPALERETLQRASVVGQVFWDQALERLRLVGGETAAESTGATRAALAALRSKELIFSQEPSSFAGSQEYIFKHAMLRDVVYESVLKRQRRAYHAEVAAWLVERSGERVAQYAGLIGGHYEHAEERLSAGEWYARAGQQAQETNAPHAAIGYYRQALALLPATAEYAARRLAAYEGLGEMLRWQARYGEAAAAYATMRAAAEAAGDRVAQARSWRRVFWLHERQGDYPTALECAWQAEDLARAAGGLAGQVELASALYIKGWGFYRLGDGEAALALGEQALSLATALDARREIGNSLSLLANVHDMQGQYEQAVLYREQALALARELGDRERMASLAGNIGENARLRGDYARAIAVYEEALLLAREIHNRELEMFLSCNLGAARVGRRDYAAAEVELRQAIRLAEAAGERPIGAAAYGQLAMALLGQGQLEAALATGRQALELGQAIEQQECIGLAWRALGQVAAGQGAPVAVAGRPGRAPRPYEAAACFAQSLRVFTRTAMEGERARTLRIWAGYELRHGDRARGVTMWQEARATFTRLGMHEEAERTVELILQGAQPGG